MVRKILIFMDQSILYVSITNMYAITHRIPKMTPKAQNRIRTYNYAEKNALRIFLVKCSNIKECNINHISGRE